MRSTISRQDVVPGAEELRTVEVGYMTLHEYTGVSTSPLVYSAYQYEVYYAYMVVNSMEELYAFIAYLNRHFAEVDGDIEMIPDGE
eukprot:468433-Karenia_brevis.AAC.1